MNKKFETYEELLIEKQKLEVLFQVQKTLVKYEIDDIKSELDPAFNALEFLKKLATRNTHNPVMQTGVNLLINALSNKIQGDNAGFLRTTVLPHVLKNYASNLLAGHADELIGNLLSLFSHEEESPLEN